jgi:hypothetical protein
MSVDRKVAGRRGAVAFLLFFALIGIAACSNPESPRLVTLPLMPLEIGNRWSYRTIHISDGDTTEGRPITMELVRTVAPAGLTYFTVPGGLIFGARGESLSVARFDSTHGAFDDFEFLLRYPVAAGTIYYYLSPYVSDSAVRIDTRADNVVTSLGTLRAIIYSINAGALEFGFTPGIGLVYMANAYGTRWILSSYALASPQGQGCAQLDDGEYPPSAPTTIEHTCWCWATPDDAPSSGYPQSMSGVGVVEATVGLCPSK